MRNPLILIKTVFTCFGHQNLRRNVSDVLKSLQISRVLVHEDISSEFFMSVFQFEEKL